MDLCKYGRLFILKDVLYRYRLVYNSLSKVPRKIQKKIFSIRKSYVQTGYLSENDINFINNLKDKRSIREKKSDYSVHIGKILLNHNKKESHNWFIKAFIQNPLKLISLGFFILSFLPNKMLSILKYYKKAIKNLLEVK